MSRFAPIAFAVWLACLALPLAATDLDDALREGYDSGELPGLHSVLVLQGDKVLSEVYFTDSDEVWGTPVGPRQHGPHTLHDLRSVTKSIVSLLYGIALADGLVPPPEASVLSQFPQYDDLASPERSEITIADLLTMRSGLAWDETLPYTDPRNSEIAMERAPDRIRYVLEQPVVAPAGETFAYSGGATAVLAELITRGADQPLDVFARERLFDPLGIHRYEWVRGADGQPSAASGLRLTARGLARIGTLILNGGAQGDAQIVPRDWIETSFMPRATTGPLRYGYHWWLSPEGATDWAAALGNGGQRMTIVNSLGLVVVVYAGNYNAPNAWEVPASVITKFVVPAMGLE